MGMARFSMQSIGGGVVNRAFNSGGVHVKRGTKLSREEILAYPAANRLMLIDQDFINVWPKSGDAVSPPVSSGADPTAERHVVALGFGRYAVIEGKQLNAEPLSRADAYALAGKTEPEAKKRRA